VKKSIGWLGVVFGFLVAPVPLISILQTPETAGISIWTYAFLVCALACYLYEAIRIKSRVFIVAQSISICINSIILVLLVVGC